MRIRKVYVKSFGPLKNKEVVVSPGLNVIYGPNGSGKTSLAEFIGTCLSPMDRKDRYPSCSKDDSGSVLMYEYDGETTVTIRGRSRFGRNASKASLQTCSEPFSRSRGSPSQTWSLCPRPPRTTPATA